jgi:hypothetical protein
MDMDALLRIKTRDESEILKNKVGAVVSKKTKAPKGVSSTEKNGEFSKFTPMQTPNAPPIPWDDEDIDDLVSAVDLDDDGKFETENDIFIKQDQEWHELMKEADTINNDDTSSEGPEGEIFKANFDDDSSCSGSDVSNIDSELEDGDVFYKYTVKEPKVNPKTKKIYSGIPIDFDDT